MVWQKPREIAARILLRHASGGVYLEDAVDRGLEGARLPGPDRGLVQELCYGTTRWTATLDWLIDRQIREGQASTPARVLLRLGLYQMFWMDRIPRHAALFETVEVAGALGIPQQSGFINAVLRAYDRTSQKTVQLLAELRLGDPAVGWSHPRWLVDRWLARLGPEALGQLLAWNNSPAPVYARVNTLKADPARLIETWREEGVDYDFGRWDWIESNLVFKLRRHPPMDRWKSLQAGNFYLQDPSTLLAVHLLAPRAGEEILDLCAAPGGKTTYIAQLVDNDGRLVATDPDPRRRQRLAQNCERLGADVTVTDPGDPLAQGPFDAILVDAPCSNTGVLRRRLDARWRLTPDELSRCRAQQQTLVGEALRRLRPGGRIVYSTCSLEPEENLGVLEAALAAHPHLELETSRLLEPVRDGVDGAFAGRLRRG